MILIGSRALMLSHRKACLRPPADWDLIGRSEDAFDWIHRQSVTADRKSSPPPQPKIVSEDLKTEVEYGGTAEQFEVLVSEDPDTKQVRLNGFDVKIPSLNALFALKSSHKYLKNSVFFWKTFADYHAMKACGAIISERYRDWHKVREKETYSYAHPSLNKKKADFFKDDAIDYVYDHDSIHSAVALGYKPAYTMYAKDGEEVKSDKSKFFAAHENVRLNGVLEEAAVLAIERALVPFPDHDGSINHLDKTWRFALSKVLSSITSGWFRQWGYENGLKVLKWYESDRMPDGMPGYWHRWQVGLKNGTARPYK